VKVWWQALQGLPQRRDQGCEKKATTHARWQAQGTGMSMANDTMQIGRVVYSNDGNDDDKLLALLERLTQAVERLAAAQEQQVRRDRHRLEQHITQKGPRYE
jgi:hypothetical protein